MVVQACKAICPQMEMLMGRCSDRCGRSLTCREPMGVGVATSYYLQDWI